jgi:hypothetical protein
MPPTHSRRRQTDAGAFDDRCPLERGGAGEDRKDQPAVGGEGVDRRAFTRQNLEPNAAQRRTTSKA